MFFADCRFCSPRVSTRTSDQALGRVLAALVFLDYLADNHTVYSCLLLIRRPSTTQQSSSDILLQRTSNTVSVTSGYLTVQTRGRVALSRRHRRSRNFFG